MRLTIAFFAAAMFGTISVNAQTAVLENKCIPLGNRVTTIPADGRLYVRTSQGWDEVPRPQPGLFGRLFEVSYPLKNYSDGSLHFIYVAGADTNPNPHGRSFLAIRVTSVAKEASGIVNLRRQHTAVPRGIQIGAYQDYHARDINHPSILRIYHSWQNPKERSDSPEDVRRAYAFRDGSSGIAAVRRALLIGYQTSNNRLTCVPFRLGPHLVAWSKSEDADDPIYLPSPFKITVAEAKTSDGHRGIDFHISLTP